MQQAQALAKQKADFTAGLAEAAAEQEKAVQRVRGTGQLLGSCQTTKFLPVQKRAAEAIKVTLFTCQTVSTYHLPVSPILSCPYNFLPVKACCRSSQVTFFRLSYRILPVLHPEYPRPIPRDKCSMCDVWTFTSQSISTPGRQSNVSNQQGSCWEAVKPSKIFPKKRTAKAVHVTLFLPCHTSVGLCPSSNVLVSPPLLSSSFHPSPELRG